MDVEQRVEAGETLEPDDELPDEYCDLLSGMITFVANSEFMGAFTERQWIPKAPSYHRKLALMAKIQDEIGHAQMQYQIAENLGADREEMLEELLNGEAGFGNAFHYPVEGWVDIALIAWLIDGAAMQLQHSLMNCNYGPYARVMQRVCREEEFHLRHGENIVKKYATGSRAMQEEMQAALDKWWPRGMMFFGTSNSQSEKMKRMGELGIRPRTNNELRQDFLETFVPKIRRFGFEVPDENIEYDESEERWRYSDPDWDELKRVVTEGGPKTEERLTGRSTAFEDTAWVRNALSAYHGRTAERFSNGTASTAGD